MNELCPIPGCGVERITRDGPGFHIAAHGTGAGGRCPGCGRVSTAVHSTYRRHPADLPSFGREVRLTLRVRRFYCRDATCPRRTFAERLPGLIVPHARRTPGARPAHAPPRRGPGQGRRRARRRGRR